MGEHACNHQRRRALATLGGFLLTPLALSLSACKTDHWPEGMAEIKWDRDTCTRCNMVISDRRFAIEMRGGPQNTVFKFDDVGCLVFWLHNKQEQFPWMHDTATRLWVADYDSKSRDEMRWLDPMQAHFIRKQSPMGYNFAAIPHTLTDGVSYDSMRQHVLAKGK